MDDVDQPLILEDAHKRMLKRAENLIGPLDRFTTEDTGVLTSHLLSSALHSPFVAGMIQAAIAFHGGRDGPHKLAVRMLQLASLRKATTTEEDPSMSYGIWTTISGGVTGERAAWIVSNGLELSFATKAEAQADVDRRRKQTSLHGGRTLTGQPIAHQTYEVRERPKRPS